jgi:hypothetical protein
MNSPPKEPWFAIKNQQEAAQAASDWAMGMWNTQGVDRRSVAEDATTLYFGNPRHTVNGGSVRSAVETAFGIMHDPQAQNVVQMIVDTMVSHTMKDRVRAFFLTDGGDSDAKEKAKGMMRAVEGVFMQNGVWEDETPYQHGYLYDAGLTKVVTDYARNRVSLQQIPCWEWLVPREEKKNPRQAAHVYTVDRYQLLEDHGYEEDEEGNRVKSNLYEKILTANPAPRDMLPSDDGAERVTDRIVVQECFHLPSGWVDLEDDAAFGLNDDGEMDPDVDPGHDGRRMLILDKDIVLADEPYPYEEFPVAEFLPARNPDDYWSRGVPETLAGAQLMVNKSTRRISNIMHLNAVSRLLVDRRAKLNMSKFTNDLVSILECTGSPAAVAMYLQGAAPPAELFAERDRYIDWMKSQYGVNEMSLYGEKPAGLDHAPGMEHMLDEQNLRHLTKFRARDRYVVKLARLVVESCRMLALRDKNFEVVWGDDKTLKRIKWKEVELNRSQFLTKVWATNLLPQLPAQKMKRLAELAAIVKGTPMEAQIMASVAEEYPDVEAIVGKINAKRRNIEDKLAKVARDGMNEETFPHPYINYELAKSMAEDEIAELERNGDAEAMENVIEFWEACDKAIKELAAQQAPPPAPPMAAPPGMPPAPPLPMPAAPGVPIQ